MTGVAFRLLYAHFWIDVRDEGFGKTLLLTVYEYVHHIHTETER